MSDAALAAFGAGGGEPYAHALRRRDLPREDQMLFLREVDSDSPTPPRAMDVSRWNDPADTTDLTLLDGIRGAVLDIGCGPGRMVRAAMDRGLTALGIDVSPAAVKIALDAGLTVLNRSVFEPLPREGHWAATLLVDGNIGIGGDPSELLYRSAELIHDDGFIVVEVHPDPLRDHMYDGTVVDMRGQQSAAFPWAEIGQTALARRAKRMGLRVDQAWEIDDRFFCRLAKA